MDCYFYSLNSNYNDKRLEISNSNEIIWVIIIEGNSLIKLSDLIRNLDDRTEFESEKLKFITPKYKQWRENTSTSTWLSISRTTKRVSRTGNRSTTQSSPQSKEKPSSHNSLTNTLRSSSPLFTNTLLLKISKTLITWLSTPLNSTKTKFKGLN